MEVLLYSTNEMLCQAFYHAFKQYNIKLIFYETLEELAYQLENFPVQALIFDLDTIDINEARLTMIVESNKRVLTIGEDNLGYNFSHEQKPVNPVEIAKKLTLN